jgi:hypothetical protein
MEFPLKLLVELMTKDGVFAAGDVDGISLLF